MVARRVRIVKKRVCDFSRDFWVGKPLIVESELAPPNHSPAFWYCSDKTMTRLLFHVGRPNGHGIRQHSLNVTTISVLMTEVIKGHANLSQLAFQGNYRAATVHDMVKVYSRNLAHRKIFASKWARGAFKENKDAESIVEDPSVFLGECLLDKTPLAEEFQGLEPADWPLDILKRELADVLKKDRTSLGKSFDGIDVPNGQLES